MVLYDPPCKIALNERVCSYKCLWTMFSRNPDILISKVVSFHFGPHGGEVGNTERFLARLAASCTARLNV